MIAAFRRVRRLVTWLVAVTLGAVGARAQMTESPDTVAPGKFLLEVDGVRWTIDRSGGIDTREVAIGSTLVSTGLRNDLDLQFGADLFHRVTVKQHGERESQSGVGDVHLRTKWTFWREPNRGAAAAVIPFVKLPTNSDGIGNDAVEGGVIVPWAMPLAGATLGAMAQWDYVRNDADDGYRSHWSATAYVDRSLARGFAVYGEAVLETVSGGFSECGGLLGGGVRWDWSEQIQFDYQLLRGLNARVSDWTHVFRVNCGW